jgi:hypothetical protein
MSTPETGCYLIPEPASTQLELMVQRIEANPGKFVDPAEYECEQDIGLVLSTLPPELSQDDFAGILKLAMLTECATDSYAAEISRRGAMFEADWLVRFNERVWVPDEYTHAAPFKGILLAMGFSEDELDREIREAQERPFVHAGGQTPVQVTTFGMVQEYLTDHWHGLIARLLKPGAPDAARMIFHVKQRETLHMAWYRDMTAVQVGANPELFHQIASELSSFRLPGNSVAPEIQCHAEDWLKKMGANFNQVARDLVRHLRTVSDSESALGCILLEAASERFPGLKPARSDLGRWLLSRFDGLAYSLVGEAVLERLGLTSFLESPAGHGVGSQIRRVLRGELARRLPALTTEGGI